MRAGLAIVATDVGGVAEAVEHERNGLMVPPGDADALASALERLLGDAGLRSRLGAAARETYETRFRIETMVERTLAVYAETLGGPGARHKGEVQDR